MLGSKLVLFFLKKDAQIFLDDQRAWKRERGRFEGWSSESSKIVFLFSDEKNKHTATFIWIRCLACLWREMRSIWRTKPILKILLASWTFYTVEKGFGSFIVENSRYVGKRTAKLLAIKLCKWFDPGPSRIRADWFEWGWSWAADFFLRPPTLKASNFEAL